MSRHVFPTPRTAEGRVFARLTAVYVGLVALMGLLAALPAQGLGYGLGAYGTCQFSSCSITLTSSTTLAADITPAGSSTTCTVVKDDVSVRTGSTTGFTLQVNDEDTTTSLAGSNGGSIAAVSGSRSSPATLSANTWGYRVDGVAGFGAGPTSAVANAGVPSVAFAAMPPLGSPDALAVQSGAANIAVVIPVWYGLCSDTTIPSGSYSNNIVYTAIIN